MAHQNPPYLAFCTLGKNEIKNKIIGYQREINKNTVSFPFPLSFCICFVRKSLLPFFLFQFPHRLDKLYDFRPMLQRVSMFVCLVSR